MLLQILQVLCRKEREKDFKLLFFMKPSFLASFNVLKIWHQLLLTEHSTNAKNLDCHSFFELQ